MTSLHLFPAHTHHLNEGYLKKYSRLIECSMFDDCLLIDCLKVGLCYASRNILVVFSEANEQKPWKKHAGCRNIFSVKYVSDGYKWCVCSRVNIILHLNIPLETFCRVSLILRGCFNQKILLACSLQFAVCCLLFAVL